MFSALQVNKLKALSALLDSENKSSKESSKLSMFTSSEHEGATVIKVRGAESDTDVKKALDQVLSAKYFYFLYVLHCKRHI